MNNQKTVRVLEDLAKSEYTTATALDAALTETEDGNLRRNYRKWRDSHIKQAEALNSRIKQLGGHTTHYEFREGNLYPIFWNLMRGSHDNKTLAGVRQVVGRSLRQYMDHLDEINDLKTLNLLRRNLATKQDEMKWYDAQVAVEHDREIGAELKKTREVAKNLEKELKEEKQTARRVPASPLTALVVAGAIGAAAYLVARRNEGMDEAESADAFTYETGDNSARLEVSMEA